MTPPKDRKRKFHKRSKNGCQTCKKRHVRCDERQPLCTSCLQTGAECTYTNPKATTNRPVEPKAHESQSSGDVSHYHVISSTDYLLNDYVGGSFDDLPATSKRLLQHFSKYAVWGQRPVVREFDSSLIHKAFENPGYMHMCLMLSACQWAWTTGSMDVIRVSFLYHKSGMYQFAREQLLRREATPSRDTLLAISTLALTEGAIGDLDTSSKHLKGFKTAMQHQRSKASLPQKILTAAGESLRINKLATLAQLPQYQPTFMALLFMSIWDISVLPPPKAPKYGWWEGTDTQAARLWQNHTRDLKLDYEISRGFDPNTYKPRILNGDPRSSRTSFVATFFYLVSEVGDGQLDIILIDWLLEQLIDDVSVNEEHIPTSPWNSLLRLWCVMFGAAIADSGRATNSIEEKQLANWKRVYYEKIRSASQDLGIIDWSSVKSMWGGFMKNMDDETEEQLSGIWRGAIDCTNQESPESYHERTSLTCQQLER